MKKSMFALACAASIAAFAEQTVGSTATFEGYTPGASVDWTADPDTSAIYWLYKGDSGATDGSTVKAYETEGVAAPTDGGANFLDLSTEGGTLWRSVEPLEGKVLTDGTAVPEGGLFIDTMVQFTPTEDGGAPTPSEEDKLAIWLNVDSEKNTTNLCVLAAVVDDAGATTTTTFTITNAGDIQADTWYHLKVQAVADLTDGDSIPGFKIFLDDVLLTADKKTLTDDFAEILGNDDVDNKVVFASLRGSDVNPTLSAVGFKGSGKLDNLTITDEDPNPPTPESIDFTLSWPEGATAVKYTIGDGEEVTLTAGQLAVGSLKIEPMPGTAITMKVTNANGVEKTLNATAGTGEGQTDELAPAEDTWNKVTVAVTQTNASADISVKNNDVVEEGATITIGEATAAEGYKNATVTVTVDGEVVADYSEGITIGADTESVSIAVTATALATPTFTVTPGANSTATIKVNDAAVESAPATLTEGQTYEVVFTADEGYEFADGATTTFTGTAAAEAITVTGPDAKAKTIAVESVTIGNKPTAAMKVGDEITLTATVAPENATDPTVAWSVTGDAVTVVDGKVTAVAVGEATVTATAGEQSDSVTITVVAAGKVYPDYVPEGKKEAYDTWADTYKVADRTDSEAALKDAFLLNCDPDDAEAEAGKFTITSITIDAEGKVTVVAPEKNSKGADFNGTVEVKGAATVDGEYKFDATDAAARFFKAFLK